MEKSRYMYPVEESGDMLLMIAALAKAQGNAAFANEYWLELEQWARYLRHEAADPTLQVTTDDFTGLLAHNANLSIKAIVALAAFAHLAEQTGHTAEAEEFRALVRDLAQSWQERADNGDHYRLAFDQAGTWSQKYNLVWDRILGLNAFPPEVSRKELAFYKTKLNKYGLPLDSRATFTKLDWLTWTATMSENRNDFDTFMTPVYKFMNETTDRIPLTDFYETDTGAAASDDNSHFQARYVVGGVFIRMLADEMMWQKWAEQATTTTQNGEGAMH